MLEKDFYLGGRAIFTVIDSETGEHSTFRITRKEWDDGSPNSKPAFYFAALLTGPDNERDYSYLGKLDPTSGELKTTQKSRMGVERQTPWKRLQSALDLAWDRSPELRVVSHHCGRCSRCGRTLTDPESIERGIGPVCVEASW